MCVSAQTKRSERDGNVGLMRQCRPAGRVDQKGKHARRHSRQTQNGHREVLQSVQQQWSSRRSAKSPDPRTGVGVQDERGQVHLSFVQSECNVV